MCRLRPGSLANNFYLNTGNSGEENFDVGAGQSETIAGKISGIGPLVTTGALAAAAALSGNGVIFEAPATLDAGLGLTLNNTLYLIRTSLEQSGKLQRARRSF